jgi:hypothetical protein
MRLLFATMFLMSISSVGFATIFPGESCDWSQGRLAIRGNSVVLDGKAYQIGKEAIFEVYGVNESGMFESSSHSVCKAKTILPIRTDKGDVVVLTMYRSKPSYSAGFLCGVTSDLSKFEDPFAFQQIVLSKDETGRLEIKNTTVWDGIGRPNLKVDELKNPNLVEQNQALKTYIEQPPSPFKTSSGKPFKLADSSIEICAGSSATGGVEQTKSEADR